MQSSLTLQGKLFSGKNIEQAPLDSWEIKGVLDSPNNPQGYLPDHSNT